VVGGFGGTDEEAVAAAEAGLSGYIGIHQPLEDVISAVQCVVRGEASCDGRVTAALLRQIAARADDQRAPAPLPNPVSTDGATLHDGTPGGLVHYWFTALITLPAPG
jgi:hypothetical protein